MALQHLRSSTADKRPDPAAMSAGQLAINNEATSPGLFFKDSGGNLVKVGPVHVGTTAPNATPASGGTAGNSLGEQWLDTSGSTYVFKVWDGSAWRSEVGEFVNASGDTMTGNLVMDNQQQVRFRETTANGTNYIAIQAPASVASDKTLTLPDATGTLVSTGDTGSVTSTMIADGTIVNGDINASAAIAGTKISPDFGSQNIATTGNITVNAQGDVRFGDADSSNWVAFQAPTTVSSNVTWTLPGADGTSGQVLSTDGSGTLSWATGGGGGSSISTGNTSATVTDTGSDGRFTVTTEGTERMRVDASGRVLVGTSTVVTTQNLGTAQQFQIEGAGSWAGAVLSTNKNNSEGAYLSFRKSRAITAGGVTVVSNGDEVGVIAFEGADGTNSRMAANIGVYVDGTPGTNDMPGRIVLATTADGASSPTERMRIDSSGNVNIDSGTFYVDAANNRVGVGTTSPNTALHVNGDVRLGNSTGAVLSGGAGTNVSFGNASSAITDGTAYQNVSIGYLALNSYTGTGYTNNTAVGNAALRYTTSGTFNTCVGSGAGTNITTGTYNYCFGYNAGGSITTGSNNVIIGNISGTSTLANTVIVGDGAGNERFRCDSSGRLLVGTSSADTNYRYIGSTSSSYAPTVQIKGSWANGTLALNTTNDGSVLWLANSENSSASGRNFGVISFNGNDGTLLRDAATIAAYADGTTGSGDMPGRLVFSTTADGASSPTERLRITNAGRVLFGATAPTAENELFSFQGNNGTLSMFNVTGGASQWPIRCWNTAASGTINQIVFMDGGGTARGSITTNASSTAYNTTSDYRLKENVELLAGATERLAQIPVHRFNFIGSDATVDGFLAHEVQEVVPESVIGTKDEVDADGNPIYQGIDQSKLVPLLTAALQEAIAKIETLEANNADLLARVSALEST